MVVHHEKEFAKLYLGPSRGHETQRDRAYMQLQSMNPSQFRLIVLYTD